jgi:hypothetical protein
MKIAVPALLLAVALSSATAAQVALPRDQLVGKYQFKEEGMTVDVHLNADGTALYSIGGSEGVRSNGYWNVTGERIHVFNKPGPVRLAPAGAPTRDAGVALRVIVTLPDGSPADGLAVTWPDATGLFYMSNGRNVTPLEEGPVIGEVVIVREADGEQLAAFMMKPGAANVHRFTYHPSDVEPFDYEAQALDASASVLEVELGSASAKLHRVKD